MKRENNSTLRRIAGLAAANAALFAIIGGLYIALDASNGRVMAASALPVSISAGREAAIYRGSNRRNVAPVFMMSWDAAATENILDTLKKLESRATFAVTDEWAARNASLIYRMKTEGHEIAVALGAGAADKKAELMNALNTVERLTFERPKLFFCGARPDDEAMRSARSLGLTNVIGSRDLVAVRGSASEILERCYGNTKGGDIVLLAPTGALSEALEPMLEYFSSMGLTSATVSGTIYD